MLERWKQYFDEHCFSRFTQQLQVMPLSSFLALCSNSIRFYFPVQRRIAWDSNWSCSCGCGRQSIKYTFGCEILNSDPWRTELSYQSDSRALVCNYIYYTNQKNNRTRKKSCTTPHLHAPVERRRLEWTGTKLCLPACLLWTNVYVSSNNAAGC